MEYPDDAEPDVYQTTFVYEKDGVQKTFTIDDYPAGDSTWHFVDQKSVLVKKGYEPPIHDFEIINQDFEDITDDVLSAESATLVVMYDVNKARRSQDKNLMEMISSAYCNNLAQNLYILTGSGEYDVEEFVDSRLSQYFNEYIDKDMLLSFFCFVDPVTLKTIVRANPGIVNLREGTVASKYAMRDYEYSKVTPAFYDASDVPEEESDEDDGYSESENYGNDDVYTGEQDFSEEP